jgi:phospholipase C
MRYVTWLSVLALILCAGLLLGLNACGGASKGSISTTPPPTIPKIKHVVIIFQENRTPDNLFQDSVLIGRGADIKNSGMNSLGQTIQLTPLDLGNSGSLPDNYDPGHSHAGFLKMYDGGKMDGADLISISCDPATLNCPSGANLQFKYVSPSDVQPYFQLAEQYTFGDRMFQTNQGPSFPAHQFIISGTSAPSASSNLFDADNPDRINNENAGCIAPSTETVSMIDPAGNLTTQYPCFDHPTITDLLKAKGVTWRYYAPEAGSIWTAPNAIQHMCGPDAPPPNGTSCVGSDWTDNVVLNHTQVLTDISSKQLAQVSWVIPDGKSSDHSYASDGSGPSWVASVVNAIGGSQYWADTAIFITWDDWGGWYDHVAPTVINSYEYGFRVPLIVVSPYAKANYISHTTHHFGSILKFIEETFSLPSLNYADADAAADDFSDCFNFEQTPLPFQTISAPLDAKHFINDKSPPTAPDND